MIKSWITRKLAKTVVFEPVAPDAPFYAIGDIHGRVDLLQKLLDLLDPDIPVICLGDYVDRGEHSSDVLRLLHKTPAITCLKGNHESMMLDLLYGSNSIGHNWLRNGGLATLASFGITGLKENAKDSELEQASMDLRKAMGDDLITWLLSLPLFWQSGNMALVHAGADPRVAIANQRPEVLTWGHPEFTKTPRSDGIWIVHGHTIVEAPRIENGRIAIDTGAYATGRLTAALVASDRVSFLST